MSKSQNNNIFVWIGLCILLIFPNIARTQSIKLTLFVTDSLTEESVTNYSVYIDDSIVFPSFDETNAAHFVLHNAIDHTFKIRVHKFHYYDRIFDLKMPKTLSDTTVQVKMNYIFQNRSCQCSFSTVPASFPTQISTLFIQTLSCGWDTFKNPEIIPYS